MSYYWFYRQEILQKNKEAIKEKSRDRYKNLSQEEKDKIIEYQKKYSKEKAAEYYLKNKEAIKEKAKNRYKNLSQEEKRQD